MEPGHWVKAKPPTPTVAFDTYWAFASERQRIFEARLKGVGSPWTTDAVLQRYKFTNAFRASDRTSQFLIRHVSYSGETSAQETFFRTLLFKLFNRIETWELLVQHLGEIRYAEFDWQRCDDVLTGALRRGERIYSSAYIMPAAPKGTHRRKHRVHLALLRHMMGDRLAEHLLECRSLSAVYARLKRYPGIGPFLAFQYAIDLNYSKHLSFSEMSFVVPGPGARDGIAKCFSSLGDFSETDVIHWVAGVQGERFSALGLRPCTLWSRPLQLVDCQNLFCEVDKYARIAHPELKGRSGRSRIKQLFHPRPDRLRVWYPPKWGINEKINNNPRATHMA